MLAGDGLPYTMTGESYLYFLYLFRYIPCDIDRRFDR